MYDYQGAIKAGANPNDIVNYLAGKTGYDAQGALKAGANQEDVLAFMAHKDFITQNTPAPIAQDNSPTTPTPIKPLFNETSSGGAIPKGTPLYGPKILNALTSSEQTLGNALTALDPYAQKTADQINSNSNASQQLLLHAIRVETDPAKKQHMMDAYGKIWGNLQSVGASDINPAYDISTEKALGALGGTALDIASAGTLPGAASQAVAPASGIVSGAIQGAKAGAKVAAPLGAAYGITNAMQADKSAGDVALSGLGGGVLGGVTGGVLGGVAGGISGGINAYQQRQVILGTQENAGIRTPLTTTLENNPQLKPLVNEAQNQGLSEKDINFLATASPADKPTMQKMLKLAEQSQTDNRVIERPLDVVGDNGTKLLKVVQNANSDAARRLNQVSQDLAGETVDATPLHDQAMKLLSDAGVTANADGTPNWATSQFNKTPALQKQLTIAFSDLPSGDVSALDLHKFKQSLYNLSDYGIQGEGLSGKADGIVKQVAHLADGTLDSQFPAYAAVNSDFSTTRSLLDQAKQVIGKQVDFNTPAGSQAFGQSLRSAFSNNKSRGTVLQFINNLQTTANNYGANSKQSLLDQALFTQVLEENFGSPAVTGLSGEVGKALDKTKTVMGVIRHPLQGALNAAAYGLQKSQGINPENKIRVLKALLK